MSPGGAARLPLIGSALRATRRFGLFALSVGTLALSSLWFVRSAIQASDLDSWASVAVGQTIGAIVAIVVGFGWSISGPTRIASASGIEAQREEFAAALRVRSLILILGCLALLGGGFAFPGIDPTLAFMGGLPVMTIALSASFFFVGTAAPMRLFILETLPRVLFTLIACVLMSFTGAPLMVGLISQILGALTAVLFSSVYILRRKIFRVWVPSAHKVGIWRTVAGQSGGLSSALLVSVLGNAPLLIVTFVAPAALPAYSVVDKLSKQILAGSSPVTAVLQGWVPRAGRAEIRKRSKTAVQIAWLAGVGVAIIVGLASPMLVAWIAAGEYTATPTTAILMGGFVGLFLIQNAVSFAGLAAQERLKVANVSMAVCASIGLVLVAVLSPFMGVDGALLGICLGMLGACAWQSVAVLRW